VLDAFLNWSSTTSMPIQLLLWVTGNVIGSVCYFHWLLFYSKITSLNILSFY